MRNSNHPKNQQKISTYTCMFIYCLRLHEGSYLENVKRSNIWVENPSVTEWKNGKKIHLGILKLYKIYIIKGYMIL